MRVRTRVWALASCLLATACGDSTKQLELPQLATPPASNVDPGHQTAKECDGAEEGTACGKAGSGMHCIFDACVRNSCGDGVKASWEAEECDDGNQRDHDGCDSHCKNERPAGCGNGSVEAGEACDDGNTADDDSCTHLCTVARCGDRIVSRGEDCDDGNLNEQDGCTRRCRTSGAAGSGAAGAGGASAQAGRSGSGGAADGGSSAGGATGEAGGASGRAGGGAGGTGGAAGRVSAGSGGASGTRAGAGGMMAGSGGAGGSPMAGAGGSNNNSAACTACRMLNCGDYMGSGLNLYAGCMLAVDPSQGAESTDPSFIQNCMDVVDCAYQNNCAYGIAGANPCYCGSATAEVCIPDGPAPDAPCVPQYQAAARSSLNDDITSRVSDFAYPLGWANFLLECDRDFCSTPAAGKCTP